MTHTRHRTDARPRRRWQEARLVHRLVWLLVRAGVATIGDGLLGLGSRVRSPSRRC